MPQFVGGIEGQWLLMLLLATESPLNKKSLAKSIEPVGMLRTKTVFRL
jgi:hypothetical protein